VRVITATNCDLESAVAAGKFREDLYFRLNVVTITIPPLRDRREEIPMLTDHFVKKYSVQYNKPFSGVLARAGAAVHGVRVAGQRPSAREHGETDGRPCQRGAHRSRIAAAGVTAPPVADAFLHSASDIVTAAAGHASASRRGSGRVRACRGRRGAGCNR
jgi:hypothetical protein